MLVGWIDIDDVVVWVNEGVYSKEVGVNGVLSYEDVVC